MKCYTTMQPVNSLIGANMQEMGHQYKTDGEVTI